MDILKGIPISIHALLAESDAIKIVTIAVPRIISIHALLAESDFDAEHLRCQAFISIHALLAESDFDAEHLRCQAFISIHALLAESDTVHSRWNQAQRHFYPRSPCGERRICFSGTPHSPAISIHALLAESDPGLACFCVPRCVFLSTLSLRRATCSQVKILRFTVISIHALLAESDAVSLMVLEVPLVISIHALLAESDLVFDCAIRVFAHISIHALLAESDPL